MGKQLNRCIVVATIAVVVVPLLYGQLRPEIARWYLAAATNAVELRQGSPDEFVDSALAVYSDSEKLRDYWLFRLKQALAEDPTTTADQLRGAVAIDPAFVELCDRAINVLWRKEEFIEHIKVLELKREVRNSLNADDLNSLAYSRSLVGLDLDQALVDINKAIESAPDNWAYRDTRAWVLFQMGKPLEALKDIQFAIRELERAGAVNTWFGNLEPASDADPEAQPKLPEEYLQGLAEVDGAFAEPATRTRAQTSEWLWGTGALYYHRARILEALGRVEEAEKDWEWLRKRRLPTDGSLY
jgi:tetratricopeptide (TPR) repeat protein